MDKIISPASCRSWTRRRPLGALEQAFWLCDRNHPAHFALAAEVRGTTTPDEWRMALDALQRRHPMLAVGIAAGKEAAPFFVKVDSAPIPLRVVRATADWQAELAREMSRPFVQGQAPLVRATLLHEEGAATCILAAHHSVADGISLTCLFRDLLQSLAGRPLAPLPMPASHEAMLGFPLDVLPSTPASAAPPPTCAATYRKWDGQPPCVDHLRLSNLLSAEVRARARRERTTVHGALAATLAMAREQIVGAPSPGGTRILSPMDTRGLLGLDGECALVVEAAISRVSPRPGDTVWNLARQVTEELAPARTLNGIRAARGPLCQATAGGLDVPTAAGVFAQVYGHDLLLSNLGPLRFETAFGALCLEAVWGPAVLFGLESAQTVGVATVDGGIGLLHTSYEPIPTLLETAGHILASACGSSISRVTGAAV